MSIISKIVVASHNEGKVREIRDLLIPYGVNTLSAAELSLAEPEETELTFTGNAELKASAAAIASGLPSLSDDSGLVVDSLNGDPGIYSARWAEKPKSEGGGRDFSMAMWHVNDLLKLKENRSAHFVCALCLAMPSGKKFTYLGKVEGEIVWPPRGERGFGYDPIFLAEGDVKTFGEMDPSKKHAKSHRARAFEKLILNHF
ncbi:RdgB/HAM1 family non-canonical purine NTP pyrophosphatase [Hellea sp.]|jgi:XTP/dITP diphosphohydrolase|nr:RdgB/HAM1 family non-canonical purine NTP pyrophosphatase [Hellea sp.]